MIKVHRLDNGLRIVMEALPFVRSISFGIWVRNGSRNENLKINGISHFIEHMLFKGTDKRNALEIAETMDAVGGQINAYTSKEYTCYYTRTLDTHFDVALDVLTDMFFNSRFDEAEIQKERNVILEEINMYEDTPEDLVHDLLQNRIWPENPLGFSVMGTAETITFNRADMLDFLHARYTPQNTVIALAGNFEENEALKKIKGIFSVFQRNACQKEEIKTVYTPAFSVREKDIEQIHLCMGFPGIPMGSDETYTLAAVNTIFGGGMSSRLFQKIREERGLAYSVYSYHAGFADTGVFALYAGLNPSQIYDVLKLMTEEIKGLFTDRVTKTQLAKAREQLKSNFLLSLESANNRMNSIGRTLLMLDKTVTADELIEKIDAVDLDRFYQLCDKIFVLDKMSLSLVGRNVEGLESNAVFDKARG